MWECDWLRSNSSPAVFGRKSHCILSTWLESTSEVWSSTTWRKTGTGGGRSTHTHTHSSPQTRALLLLVPRDRIKVNMFPFVFLRLWGLAGFGGADWWKKRRPLEACRVEGRLVVGGRGGGGKNPRTASFLEWSTNRPQGKCSDWAACKSGGDKKQKEEKKK